MAVGMLLTGNAAWAQSSMPSFPLAHPSQCAVQPTYPLPSKAAELQSLLNRIDSEAPKCLLDGPFHAWRGAVLLSLRRPAAAIEALERALLLDPNLPGAQLDYAQALLAVGDKTSARDLLQQLSRRPDLPPNLQGLLNDELAASDPAAWRTRWVLTTALGRDTNLNNAPAASELTLTFPQGPVTLALLDSVRPQSGTSWLNIAQWQGLKPQGEQLWLLQAEVRSRHTAQAGTRYQQADVSASWLQRPEAPRQWIARVGASRVDFGGQHLLQSVRASAQHQWQADSPLAAAGVPYCRPGLGGEAELRRYPVTPELNGRYAGLVASASCQAADNAAAGGLLGTQLVTFQARWGRDTPDSASRPGGAYDKLELRAAWEGRRGVYKLNADYAFTRQTDATGYSALLSDNLPRVIDRHALRLEVARPLPEAVLGGAEWFVSLEASRQSSNLEAFTSRQTAIYSGLRWGL